MKTYIKLLISMTLLATIGLAPSCSTDNETLDIVNITNEDDPLYQEKLKLVREYKSTNHPILFAWFDNAEKIPTSRAHHITSLPDSVDIVALTNSDIADWEIKDIKTLQKDKATKVLLSFDFDATVYIVDETMRKLELEEKEQAEENGTEFTPWSDEKKEEFFNKAIDTILEKAIGAISTFALDGISLGYISRDIAYVKFSEILTTVKRQNILVSYLDKIIKDNNLLLVLQNSPNYILTQDMLHGSIDVELSEEQLEQLAQYQVGDLVERSNYIIINTHTSPTVSGVSKLVNDAAHPSLKKHKVLISAATEHIDRNDKELGKINDLNGVTQNAIIELAYWNDTFRKAGLAIFYINADYYNPELTYVKTRTAIDIMNPSPKK